MRHAVMGTIAVAAIAILGAGPDTQGGPGRNKLEGTWEHTFEDEPRLRQVKVINQDHFIWVTYEKDSKVPVTAAGGTYTLDGDTYKERVEFGRFGTPKLQELVGKEQTFQIKIDGDTLFVSGILSNGQQLGEVWKRVKPK